MIVRNFIQHQASLGTNYNLRAPFPLWALGCATAHPAHRHRPRCSLSLSCRPTRPEPQEPTYLPTRPPPAPRPAAEPSEPAWARPYPAPPAPGSSAGPRRSHSNNQPKAEQSAGPRMRTQRSAALLSAAAISAPSASRQPEAEIGATVSPSWGRGGRFTAKRSGAISACPVAPGGVFQLPRGSAHRSPGNPHTNVGYPQCSQLFIHIASHIPPHSNISQSGRAHLICETSYWHDGMLASQRNIFFFSKPTHFINTFIFVTAVRNTRGSCIKSHWQFTKVLHLTQGAFQMQVLQNFYGKI